MSKELKLAVGDVVQKVGTNEKYTVKWVGEYHGFIVAGLNAWISIDIAPYKDGYYYPMNTSDSIFELLPPKPKYCHLHTQPELQCKKQCNHCNEFDKSIK